VFAPRHGPKPRETIPRQGPKGFPKKSRSAALDKWKQGSKRGGDHGQRLKKNPGRRQDDMFKFIGLRYVEWGQSREGVLGTENGGKMRGGKGEKGNFLEARYI